MPRITVDLIRKRAEHNESVISTLEELSLHQQELECIDECLGSRCRKLKILYLQNNIINKMENLHHMKDLEYLNLALNNVEVIEGLHNCEFLNKLDLTVNFVALKDLERSVDHLVPRLHLRDLYMMGNPAQSGWEHGFANYLIAKLPQLEMLDGTHITRSMRIVATQQLPQLTAELRELAAVEAAAAAAAAAEAAAEAEAKRAADEAAGACEALAVPAEAPRPDEDELLPHTPAVRTEMYRELAEQKEETERKRNQNAPPKRDYDGEQEKALEVAREREAQGKIRQCNEGKYGFSFDEESKKTSVLLNVETPRHLDTSLIDVDVHPNYVSVVIKSKVLRLHLPAEVRADEANAQRSKITGHLLIDMPKVNPSEGHLYTSLKSREAARKQELEEERTVELARMRQDSHKGRNVGQAMLDAAPAKPKGAVNVRGLVSKARGGIGDTTKADPSELQAVSTARKGVRAAGAGAAAGAAGAGADAPPPPPPQAAAGGTGDDDDAPPPPM